MNKKQLLSGDSKKNLRENEELSCELATNKQFSKESKIWLCQGRFDKCFHGLSTILSGDVFQEFSNEFLNEIRDQGFPVDSSECPIIWQCNITFNVFPVGLSLT